MDSTARGVLFLEIDNEFTYLDIDIDPSVR